MAASTLRRLFVFVFVAAAILAATVALTRPSASRGVQVDARAQAGSEMPTPAATEPPASTGRACTGEGFLPDVVLPAAQPAPSVADRAWSVDGVDVTAAYQSSGPGSRAAGGTGDADGPLARELTIAAGPDGTTIVAVASGSADADCAELRFTVAADPDSAAVAAVRDAIEYAGLDLVAADAAVEATPSLVCGTSGRGGPLDVSGSSPSALLAAVTRSGAFDDGGTQIAHAGFVELVDGAGGPIALGFPASGGGWAVLVDIVAADGQLRAVSWAACGY